jgi:uncharacterized SAM-binding protein YcdF (DUF218 family)
METLRYLVNLLISPYLHFAFLLLVLLTFLFLKKYKWSRITGYVLSAWILLFIVLPIPDGWVHQFEDQHAPLDVSSLDTTHDYTIVILGSGKVSDPVLPPLQDLQKTLLSRLSEGVRLYHALPQTCLLTSGGRGEGMVPQAQVVAEAALSLGVAPFDTLRMDHTVNTESEAKTAVQFLAGASSVVLVTSAVHMPRAVYWFEQYGVEVIPAPTDYMIKDDPTDVDFFWEGWTNRLEYMNKAMHESVGLMYAKSFG